MVIRGIRMLGHLVTVCIFISVCVGCYLAVECVLRILYWSLFGGNWYR